jgi:glycosyltransferase involved in cell wall biosynthesis
VKIAMVWDWPPHQLHVIGWEDGLAAALLELQRRGHDVIVLMPDTKDYVIHHPYFEIGVSQNVADQVEAFKPDVVLMWGDATRPNAEPLSKLGIPMALCFAGGEPFGPTINCFNHIFVESVYYKQRYDNESRLPVSIAFGANTDLFQPIPSQPKVFDTIFPATFAHWKRHGIYAEAAKGLKSLAVGMIQPNGIDEGSWRDTMQRGTVVLPHVSSEALHFLYAASRVCVVTSSSAGGSQRTVLEAMAMNIPLIITDSDKFDYCWGHGVYEAEPTPESVRGFIDAILDGEHDVDTRPYVLENWSHIRYADALEKELARLCDL